MDRARRSKIIGAVLLILIGLALMVAQFVPGLAVLFRAERGWPLVVVGVGFMLLVIGLATGSAGMAVPACVVGGIGGLLYWQNATGQWASWAYAWTLVPGFAGLGTMLAGLLRANLRQVGTGAWEVFVSLALFVVLGSFFGGLTLFGPYWPALLIALGLALLGRSLWHAWRSPAVRCGPPECKLES